jgi:hypothetical protein
MKLWIARDKDDSLWVFENKPTRNEYGVFGSEHIDFASLSETWFPEVTFENSPQMVEIKLIKEE